MPRKNVLLVIIALLLAFGVYQLFLADSGPEIRNAQPASRVIICFGDSLTYGTGAPKGRDYPSQLAEMIKRPVVNAGIPGDTTARALTRLERDVLRKKPGVVLITLRRAKPTAAAAMALTSVSKVVSQTPHGSNPDIDARIVTPPVGSRATMR